MTDLLPIIITVFKQRSREDKEGEEAAGADQGLKGDEARVKEGLEGADGEEVLKKKNLKAHASQADSEAKNPTLSPAQATQNDGDHEVKDDPVSPRRLL